MRTAIPWCQASSILRNVACDSDSIEKIQAALRERAQKTPPGEWVLGFLYDDGKTPRPLNVHDLDAAVPDHPVMVHHRGGHTVFVNSKAFQLAQVTDQTPDPAGGRFEHDAQGHLTGFAGDAATRCLRQIDSRKRLARGLPQRRGADLQNVHQQGRDFGLRRDDDARGRAGLPGRA